MCHRSVSKNVFKRNIDINVCRSIVPNPWICDQYGNMRRAKKREGETYIYKH